MALNNQNKYRLSLKILLILAVFVCFFKIKSSQVSAQPALLSNSSSINVIGANLSGNAYLSSDASADNQTKVVFGDSNNVQFSKPGSLSSSVKINIGNLSSSTPISPLDFGANVIWYDGGYGLQNLQTYQLYPSVINQIKKIGLTVFRYPGGIPSDSFNWQYAVGPQSNRINNEVIQTNEVLMPSVFGPDEFGNLLDSTDSAGDITVNFGTGNAQEAADWAQYMTASSKTNYWGELRAANGHSAPYNIPYWEVGNEQESSSGENYWRSGSVVSINSPNSSCAVQDIHLCEYVYGGVTSFSKQKMYGVNNQLSSNGKANQTFHAQYPPIVSNSQTIYVNGKVWNKVDNLADYSGNSNVYAINYSSGAITFGNGFNGKIPPQNASILISYDSGPHDGFLEYYKLMKAADPQAKICSSYDSTSFLQLMGSTYPYDCLVVHLYAGNVQSTNSSTALFHNSVVQQSYGFEDNLRAQIANLNKYAGPRAKDVSLAVTEYGLNAHSSPSGFVNYHRSQDLALFVANALRIIINNHIPLAEKHFLISYENASPPGVQSYINSSVFANNALISGPGPNSVLQPSAYVFEAYTKLLYSNLISSSIQNNPTVVFSGGNYPALATLATTNKTGSEAIMVINLSGTQNIKALITPSIKTYDQVDSWTLGANNYLAYNTASDPNVVGFAQNKASISNGKFAATFPPGSITVLKLSN